MKFVGRTLALARVVSFSCPPKLVTLTRSLTIFDQSSSSSFASALYSTTITLTSGKYKPQQSFGSELAQKSKGDEKEPELNDWPRPSEIPWQAKVANSVNLIGTVQAPVQFEAASSGDGKYYARTVISQDAAPDTPSLRIPITFEGDLAHVAVCHLRENDCVYIVGQLNADRSRCTIGNCQTNIQVVVGSINFVERSSQWKRCARLMVQEKLAQNYSVGSTKYGGSTSSCWRNLIENPRQWLDYRTYKKKGLVSPAFPDFKSKDGKALWLDTAPDWVLSGLEALELDTEAGDLWRSLVENPEKWWDNRLNKHNERGPDLRHKVTGKSLWLCDSPAWVKSKLPPVTTYPTPVKPEQPPET